MGNDNRSGAAPTAQKSHADLIAEMKEFTEERLMLLDAMRRVGNFADCLEAAHKRELDAKDSVIQTLSSELQQLQEKREITIAAQKAKAAAEGYADGKRDATSNNATVSSVPEVPSVPTNEAKLREALVEMVKSETGGSMERDDLCGRCLEKMFNRCKHDGSCWVDKVMSALSSVGKEH